MPVGSGIDGYLPSPSRSCRSDVRESAPRAPCDRAFARSTSRCGRRIVPTPSKERGWMEGGNALGDMALLAMFVLLISGLLLTLEIGMRRAHRR